MMVDLSGYRSKITELCRLLSVKRLELVGSAARADFCPESSDIDMVIEFDGNNALFDRYFELKYGLENILGRKVDLIQKGAIKNPYVDASMKEDRTAIYEA